MPVNHAYAQDRDETSTTSTDFQDKCVLEEYLNAGDYSVIVSGEYKSTYYVSLKVEVKTVIDGVDEPNVVAPCATDNYAGYGLFVKKTFTAGSHTIKVQFRTCNGAVTVYMRNVAIAVVKHSLFSHVALDTAADHLNCGNADWHDVEDLEIVAQAGTYAAIISVWGWASSSSWYQWRLKDPDLNVIMESGGAVVFEQTTDYSVHTFSLKIMTLTAGPKIFKLQHKVPHGNNSSLKAIYFTALKLPSDYQYNANETPGTGTRAILSWTPISGHTILALEATQFDVGTGNVRNFKKDSTTLSSCAASGTGYDYPADDYIVCCVYRFFGSGSVSLTTDSAVTINSSRILALDLSTLGILDPVEPIARRAFMPRSRRARFVAETVDADGKIGVLPISFLEMSLAGTTELDSFVIRVPDPHSHYYQLLSKGMPLWIWVRSNGQVKRFWFKIDDIEHQTTSSESGSLGIFTEISGRHFASAIAYRGRVKDLTKYGQEISSIILNSDDGLCKLAPEIVWTNYVRNVGIDLSEFLEQRGTPLQDHLTMLSVLAYDGVFEWRAGACHGTHPGEKGKINMHFERALESVSPSELSPDRARFSVEGGTLRDYKNYFIIEQGMYGSSTDTIGWPTLGDVIDSYAESNQDTDESLYSGSMVGVGQTLTATEEDCVGEARFYLKKVGSPTGNITAKVYKMVGGGADGYTKLLLHCNETPFVDSATGKTVTANGDVQIDTAQSKFGGASGLFDGTGDFLSLADSEDWNFGTGDFTIDSWVRFNVLTGTQGLVQQYVDATHFMILYSAAAGANLNFEVDDPGFSGGYIVVRANGVNLVVNTWYHIAVVRNGNNWYIFVDGVDKTTASPSSATLPDFAAPLEIGRFITGNYHNGWFDEFRVSKGVAWWTSNFTPPTMEYGTVGSAVAESVPVDIADLTTSYALTRFPFISPLLFAPNRGYLLTVEYSGGDAAKYLHVGVDASTPTHAGNYCSKTGDTWTEDAAKDLCFYLHKADFDIGVAPSYQRRVYTPADQAQTLANVLVKSSSREENFIRIVQDVDLNLEPNMRVSVMGHMWPLPKVASMSKIVCRYYEDDDGNWDSYVVMVAVI